MGGFNFKLSALLLAGSMKTLRRVTSPAAGGMGGMGGMGGVAGRLGWREGGREGGLYFLFFLKHDLSQRS